MLRLSCSALALALGLLSSCHDAPKPTRSPTHGESPDGGARTNRPGDPNHRVKTVRTRRAGMAHSGAIDMVALSPDGMGALSRDAVGGVRLWPALDGSQEPIAMPSRAPQAMSLARLGDGWRVLMVDASGGAKLYDVAADGKVVPHAELPPFEPLIEAHVLPGGKHVLALFRDHSLRLLDGDAKEVARFEERKFRPMQLRISSDGKRALAVIEERTSNTTKLELQPIAITTGAKPTIRRGGTPRLFTAQLNLHSSGLAFAADGSKAAVVDKWNGAQWDVVVIDLLADTPEQRFAAAAQAHTVPALGFVGKTELLAAANDGGVAWLIDLEGKSLHVRSAPPQDFNGNVRAQSFASNRHIAGHGSWLYVADTKSGRHQFLGYRSLTANAIAISPNSRSVATVYPQGPIWVEPLAGKGDESVSIATDPTSGVFRVRFATDDRLLVVDGMGGVQLVDWHTGDVIATAGVNGSVRSVQLDAQQGLLLIDRQSVVNDSRVFELDDRVGFRGPYIIADTSYRTGLLRGGAPGHAGAVMWSLDSGNHVRFYTLAELRSDLSVDEIKQKAIDLKPGQIAPLAIDAKGRQYGVRWNGSRMEVFVDNGEHVRSKAIGDGSVNELWPTADGKRFFAVHQRTGGIGITVYDSDSLKELWSLTTGAFHNEVNWSPQGDLVAIASPTGAVVRDGATGESAYDRCGLDFEVLGTAPNTAFSTANQRSICEP